MFKKLIFLSIVAIAITTSGLFGLKYLPGISKNNPLLKQNQNPSQAVLAATTQDPHFIFKVNVPAFFNEKTQFAKDVDILGGLTVKGKALFDSGMSLNNNSLDLGTGTLTASNVLYGIKAGSGVSITPGQDPTISVTSSGSAGVTSLQSQTGALTLTAGSGISLNGLQITNNDGGSNQNIFKTITSGGTSFVAGANNDTLTFTAGSGITITPNTGNKTLTFTSTSGSGAVTGSGFTTDGVMYATGNSAITSLTPGTSGYVLQSNGTGVAPSWVNASSVGTNYWQLNSGVLSPATNSNTLAIGTTTGLSNSGVDIEQNGLGNAAIVINQKGNGDIFTASASGTPKFTVTNNGTVVVGADGGTPGNVTVRAGVASGNNTTGGNFTLDASNGTGAGGSGDIIFRTATAQSTPVSIDNTVSGGSPFSSNTTASSTFVVGSNSNRLLIVEIGPSNKATTVSSVTYNGTNLTKLTAQSCPNAVFSNGCANEVWYMTAPATGSHTLTVTLSTSDFFRFSAVSLFNVDQTTPLGTAVTASGTTSTTSSITVNNVTVSQTVMDFLEGDHVGQDVPGTGQTQTWTFANDPYSSYIKNQSGSVTMTWNLIVGSNQTDWSDIAVPINQISNASNDTLADRFHITSSGSVGLGTSAPLGSTGLDIEKNSAGNSALVVNNSGGQGDVFTASSSGVSKFVIDKNGDVGINATGSLLGTLDLRTESGTLPVASISGATSFAGLVVDNSGKGDLFTASSSGLNRFVITQGGSVGIGTTAPTTGNLVLGSGNSMISFANTATDPSTGMWLRNDGSNTVLSTNVGDLQIGYNPNGHNLSTRFFSGGAGGEKLRIDSGGNIGINTTSPGSLLDVRGANGTNTNINGTVSVASISGKTSFAALVVDNSGVGDLFTASSSGLNRFVITQNGNIGIGTTTPGGAFDVRSADTGATAGDFVVDTVNNNVLVGRLTSTSGSSGKLTIRDRFGSTIFVANNSNATAGSSKSYFNGSILGINAASPLAVLDVRANSNYGGAGTLPIASFSGTTSLAGLIVDNSGVGDIFTASSSGLNRFVITQNGNVGIGNTLPTRLADIAGTAVENTNGTASQLSLRGTGSTTQKLNIGYDTTNNEGYIEAVNENVAWQNLILQPQGGFVGIGSTMTAPQAALQLGANAGSATPHNLFLSEEATGTNGSAQLVGALRASTGWGIGTNNYTSNDQTLKIGVSSNATGSWTTTNGDLKLMVNGPTNASALSDLDVRTYGGTIPVASLSGATSFASLVVDNSGAGDLFTASSSGLNRFVITQAGNVGINTSAPSAPLYVSYPFSNTGANTPALVLDNPANGSDNTSLMFETGGNNRGLIRADNGGQLYIAANSSLHLGTNALSSPAHLIDFLSDGNSGSINFTAKGYVGIGYGLTSPLATLDVRPAKTLSGANGATIAIASISGTTTFAALVANNDGTGDLFTASASSIPVFKIDTNGNTRIGGSLCVKGVLSSTCAGNAVGTIYATNTTVQAADVAENYVSSQTLEPGDVIMPAADGDNQAVIKTTSAYQTQAIGVVSTKPGVTLNSDAQTDSAHPNLYPIALQGRVPVKVSTSNGTIHAGDLLTSSGIPGVAMRATTAGQIIGKSLEDDTDTNTSNIQKIMVFVNISWADPNMQLAITNTGNLSLNGKPINTQTQSAAQVPDGTQANEGNQITQLQQQVASLSAQLGKIDDLSQTLTNLEKTMNINQALANSSTQSAVLGINTENTTFTGDLSIGGKTTVSDLGITGKITDGLLSINGLDTSATPSATINTLSAPLKIQSLALNGIAFENGAVTIDTNGNITTTGNITAKTVTADKVNINPNGNAAAIGEGTIMQGQTKVTIKTTAVTKDSKIFVTEETMTRLPLIVTQKVPNQAFTVEIADPQTEDIKFNWWLSN